MSQITSMPSFSEVNHALKKTPEKYHASQIHGLFCGLICGTLGNPTDPWKKILGDTQNEKNEEILQQLYETSYHLMNEFSFEFTLLLPNDSKNLNERTEALGLWCQGFITGLKQAHVRISHREPGEMTDTLNDIMEIAQVNFGDILANEEDETAYFELVEYIRLACIMIFHELKSDTPPTDTAENDLLH